MSALPRLRPNLWWQTDAKCQEAHVRIQNYSITSSAATSRAGGTVEAKCFRRFEVDDGFVLGRHLHRKIGRLGAAQDAVDIGRGPPKLVDAVGAVAHETTGRDK